MPWVAKKQMLYDGRQLDRGDLIGDHVKRSLQGTYAEWLDQAPSVTPPDPMEDAGLELPEASAPLATQPEPELLPPAPVPSVEPKPKQKTARRKKTKRKSGR